MYPYGFPSRFNCPVQDNDNILIGTSCPCSLYCLFCVFLFQDFETKGLKNYSVPCRVCFVRDYALFIPDNIVCFFLVYRCGRFLLCNCTHYDVDETMKSLKMLTYSWTAIYSKHRKYIQQQNR